MPNEQKDYLSFNEQAEANDGTRLLTPDLDNIPAEDPAVLAGEENRNARRSALRLKFGAVAVILLILSTASILLALHSRLPAYIQSVVLDSPPPRIDSVRVLSLDPQGATVHITATLDAEIPHWTSKYFRMTGIKVGSTVWSMCFQNDNECEYVGEMQVPEFQVYCDRKSVTMLSFESHLQVKNEGMPLSDMIARLQSQQMTAFKLNSNPSMELVGGWLLFWWREIHLQAAGMSDPSQMPKLSLDQFNFTIVSGVAGDALRVSFNNPFSIALSKNLMNVTSEIHYESTHIASVTLFDIELEMAQRFRTDQDSKDGFVSLYLNVHAEQPGVLQVLQKLGLKYAMGQLFYLSLKNSRVLSNGDGLTVQWMNHAIGAVNATIPVQKKTDTEDIIESMFSIFNVFE